MQRRSWVCLGAVGWLLTTPACSGDTTHSGSAGNGTGGESPGPTTVQPGIGAVPLDNLAHEMIQRLGGPCTTAEECYSNRCTNGVCVAPQDCAG
jgi:hypothetical protein